MATDDEGRIRQILSSYLGQQRKGPERANCPNDEILTGFLDGSLRGERRDNVERHLADCFLCLEEVVAVNNAMEKAEIGAEDVPKTLLEKAMALIPPAPDEPSFFELVVRLAKGSLELLSTSGQSMVTPAPLGVRRGSKRPKPSIVQVKKEMGRFKIVAEVERVDTGLCQIVVEVRDEDEKPVNGIRISLISRGREEASYLTRRGRAVFDRVAKGEYNLPISDARSTVGTIRLTVR